MTIKQMHKKHPQKVLICIPNLRDSRGFVVDWIVLHSHSQIFEAENAVKTFYEEDYKDIVLITTFTGEKDPVLSPEQSAKYFRVLLNRN